MDVAVVVDDSPTQRALYLFVLLKRFKVESCGSGEEALQVIKEKKPLLVLTDQNMPGMKGVDLAAALKNDPELRVVKIILISSERDLPRDNVDGYLIKPFKPQELVQCIERVLQ